MSLWCPYCGTKDSVNEFLTLDQRRRLRSAAQQYAVQQLSRLLDDAFSPSKSVRSGPVQIRFERGRTEIPPLLTYLERQTVRIQECSTCGGRTALYGIALYCAYCGQSDSLSIFLASIQASRACLAAASLLTGDDRALLQATGGEDRLTENALTDMVSAFEVYCKHRYAELVGTSSLQSYLKTNGKNAFQRLDGATAAMEAALGRTLTSMLRPGEWKELRLAFAARHVLTHNAGVADSAYITAGGAVPFGQRIQITRTTSERALRLVEQLIRGMN